MSAGAAPASASASLPPQGLYEACYPGAPGNSCIPRLQRLGGAGFQVVMNYWMLAQSTPAQIVNYVQAAAQQGIKVIWPLNDWWSQDPQGNNMLANYPLLAAACGCSTNQGLVDYIVGLARSQPNTWGYYIADEPDPLKHAQLKAFSDRLTALDPAHQQLLVACACGDPTGTVLVAPFADLGATTTLANDQYAVVTQPQNPLGVYSATAGWTQGLQALADQTGHQSAAVLQAFSFGDGQTESAVCGSSPSNCRFPSEQEMQMQRDAAVNSGRPGVILWFGLFDVIGYDPTQQPSYWQPVPNPQQRWSDLVQAALGSVPAPAPQPAPAPAAAPTPQPDSSPQSAATPAPAAPPAAVPAVAVSHPQPSAPARTAKAKAKKKHKARRARHHKARHAAAHRGHR
ncbi:MAG: hypothetical protein NVSMB51_16150 [Solirubrobacteraceae bacterium]